jgi:hypothetical protein
VEKSGWRAYDLGAAVVEEERSSSGVVYEPVKEAAKEVDTDKRVNSIAWSRTFFVLIRFLYCAG